jgi:GNAT superfamily N-acetyltransferase
VIGRAADLYVAAFIARFADASTDSVREPGMFGFSSGEAIRLLVTDDRAYGRLAGEVSRARRGSVSVFERARDCDGFMQDQPTWKPERPSTSMVHADFCGVPGATLPESLVLRPVNRLPSGAADGVPLEDAAAVAIESDPGITDPLGDFARFLRGLSPAVQLFAAVDEGGVRATSGCEVFGEYARIFFVNTKPGWRGRGVGGAMTLAALEAAARAGARHATLDATDAGASLYARLGFEDAGRMTRYFPAY